MLWSKWQICHSDWYSVSPPLFALREDVAQITSDTFGDMYKIRRGSVQCVSCCDGKCPFRVKIQTYSLLNTYLRLQWPHTILYRYLLFNINRIYIGTVWQIFEIKVDGAWEGSLLINKTCPNMGASFPLSTLLGLLFCSCVGAIYYGRKGTLRSCQKTEAAQIKRDACED